MLGNGIPGKDLIFNVLNAKGSGAVINAIAQFKEQARAENLLIHDISFVQSGDEILVIGFFTYSTS